jgi:hypothetical protein
MAELWKLVVLETLRRNAEAIRQVGQRALEKARRAGVLAYYTDRPTYEDDLIREYPNGRRERLIKGQDGVVDPALGRLNPRSAVAGGPCGLRLWERGGAHRNTSSKTSHPKSTPMRFV